MGAPRKKWDFVATKGGGSDLRITFFFKKNILSGPNFKINVKKIVCMFVKIFAFCKKLGFGPAPYRTKYNYLIQKLFSYRVKSMDG